MDLSLGIREFCFDGGKNRGKAIHVQHWTGPDGSRRLRLLDFKTIRNKKVVNLPALRTDHIYPHRKYSRYSLLLEAESIPGP